MAAASDSKLYDKNSHWISNFCNRGRIDPCLILLRKVHAMSTAAGTVTPKAVGNAGNA